MKSFLFVGLIAFVASSTVLATSPTGSYKKIVDQMQQLHQNNPSISQIFSLGQNDEGTDIYAMRISVTPTVVDPKKVAHIVVSTHHGNELQAPAFTMYFTEQLLKRYQTPEFFQTGLSDTEWVIIPVLNVTGYNNEQREEFGQDPNRDYPGPCISGQGGKLKSIRLMRDFLTTRIFTGSLTVHGYASALTYPWGVSTSNTHTLDQNVFDKVTAKAAALNGYRYGTSTDIVYPCDGAYEDYAYWKHGIWSLLLELKDGSPKDIQDTSEAVSTYFAQLDSSPSTNNQMNGQCTRDHKPDLRAE